MRAEVQALREQSSAPVESRAYALHGAEPSNLAPEDRKSERWNIYLPKWLTQAVEAEAAAVGRSPSQVLQAVVKAWAERHHQGAGEGS